MVWGGREFYCVLISWPKVNIFKVKRDQTESNLPDEGLAPVILGCLWEYYSWDNVTKNTWSLLKLSFDIMFTDLSYIGSPYWGLQRPTNKRNNRRRRWFSHYFVFMHQYFKKLLAIFLLFSLYDVAYMHFRAYTENLYLNQWHNNGT